MMRAMEDDTNARDYAGGNVEGRCARALAKRCIVLTKENKVKRQDFSFSQREVFFVSEGHAFFITRSLAMNSVL